MIDKFFVTKLSQAQNNKIQFNFIIPKTHNFLLPQKKKKCLICMRRIKIMLEVILTLFY